MHSRRNVLIFATAVAIVVALTVLAHQLVAQRDVIDEQNVIAGNDYRLSGTHSGDLVVLANSIALSKTSAVAGGAALVGKTVNISGRIDGDLTALGENLTLDSTAHIAGQASLVGANVTLGGRIDGDLYVSGKTLTILPDLQINGTLNACVDTLDDGRENAGDLACSHEDFAPFAALIALRNSAVRSVPLPFHISPAGTLALAIFGTVILAGTSALGVTLFPRQISHVEEALRSRPRGFGGVGIAVYVLGIGLALLVIFVLAVVPPLGLLLVPVFLIVGLIIGVLSLVGLITLALMLGDWLIRRFSRPTSRAVTRTGTPSGTPPLIAALTGSVVIALLLAGVTLLPFGFAISFFTLSAISSAGLGAALFTRAGTRPLRRSYFVTG